MPANPAVTATLTPAATAALAAPYGALLAGGNAPAFVPPPGARAVTPVTATVAANAPAFIPPGLAAKAPGATAYRQAYAPVTALTTLIATGAVVYAVTANPKAPGSAAAARYGLYAPGLTVAALLLKGLRRDDLRWDLARGFITYGPVA
jgi:hypothetical protein